MYDELAQELRTRAEFLNGVRGENADSVWMVRAANAIEELQLQKTHDELIDFLTFLFNHIQPNEMEHYWTMYHCLDVPTCGESEGDG